MNRHIKLVLLTPHPAARSSLWGTAQQTIALAAAE
jgi:hypothetical protein